MLFRQNPNFQIDPAFLSDPGSPKYLFNFKRFPHLLAIDWKEIDIGKKGARQFIFDVVESGEYFGKLIGKNNLIIFICYFIFNQIKKEKYFIDFLLKIIY